MSGMKEGFIYYKKDDIIRNVITPEFGSVTLTLHQGQVTKVSVTKDEVIR